jgi:hypothetical protein
LLATTSTPIRVQPDEVVGAASLQLAPPTRLTPPIATLFGPPLRGRPSVGGGGTARPKS